MSALEVVALDEAVPQLRAPTTGDTYLMPRSVAVTGEITLNGAATTIASAAADPYVNLTASHDYSATNVVMAPAVWFSGTHTITVGGGAFGSGFLFYSNPTLTNTVTTYMGPFYTLASTPFYQAAAATTFTVGQFIPAIDVLCAPTFGGGAGGTVTANSTHIQLQLTTNTGGTVTTRKGLQFSDATITAGAVTSQAGIVIPALTSATNNIGILLGTVTIPAAGNWAIYQSGSQPIRWGGPHNWAWISTTANITATARHYMQLTGTTGRNFTLPAASSFQGRTFIFIQDGTGTLTIVRDGSDTIDGTAGNYALAGAKSVIHLTSDGVSNWVITGIV